MNLSEFEAKELKHSLSEVFLIDVEPVLSSSLEGLWKGHFLKVVQGSDHDTGVLSGEFVGCLSHVDGFKLVLAPELEKFFSHTE